jgi:Flp pilus assembly protein TadD
MKHNIFYIFALIFVLNACETTEIDTKNTQNNATLEKKQNNKKESDKDEQLAKDVSPEVYLIDAAKIAEEQGDYVAAAAYWASANKYAPNNEEVIFGFSRTSRKIGMANRAIEVMEEFVQKNPNNQAVILELAKLYIAAGQYRNALDYTDKAIAINGEKWEYYSLKGVIFDRLKDYRQASAAYNRAIALNPSHWVIYNNYAMSQKMANNLSKAEELSRKAISLPNVQQIAHENLARILFAQGKTTEAEQILIEKLPPQQAASTLGVIKSEFSQPSRWKMQ